MRKLFGLEKGRGHKQQGIEQQDHQLTQPDPPIYQQFSQQSARHSRHLRRSDSADRWSMVTKPTSPTPQPQDDPLPNPHPHSTRTSSLPNNNNNPSTPATPNSLPPAPPSPSLPQHSQKPKSHTPVALSLLRSLDPAQTLDVPQQQQQIDPQQQQQLQQQQQQQHKKKPPFWNSHKDPSPTKDNRPNRLVRETGSTNTLNATQEAELTRMIGYLTATSSEDWTLVMEVCERASSNEASAKEAVKALRREFKYGEPPAQLAAARLWAIMLRNSSDTFLSQSTSKKFLEAIEDLLNSSRTSPVVRERILDVIAAAAYASGSHTPKDGGFKGLWRRVKPADKPDEGIPFDTNDSMFNPALGPPPVPAHEPERRTKKNTSSRNRVIPPEEDIIRLFQECKLGSGNAAVLLENIKFARPQDLSGDVIQEFHLKCLNSQELILSQIPWATAQAEKSRVDADAHAQKGGEPIPEGETEPEKLLAAILLANCELQEALNMYEDLKRVGIERQAEEQSKKDWRMDRRTIAQLEHNQSNLGSGVGGAAAGSGPQLVNVPPPPPIPGLYHPNHSYDGDRDHLAPPPLPPMGPRSPASSNNRAPRSRSPSPSRTPSPHHTHTYSQSQSRNLVYEVEGVHTTNSSSSLPPPRALPVGLVPGPGGAAVNNWHSQSHGMYPASMYSYATSNYTSRGGHDSDDSPTDDELPPPVPSAKALGKRRAMEETLDVPSRNDSPNSSLNSPSYSPPSSDPYDTNHAHPQSDNASISSESSGNIKPHIHYVYDAAAERTQLRLQQLKVAAERESREKERERDREKQKEREKTRDKGALNASRRSTGRTK